MYALGVIREMVTLPFQTVVALLELPATVNRSLKEANQLMASSRRQLDAVQQRTDNALEQAERMNEMLSRVVRLTEPLERAQRGGEIVAAELKRAIFGDTPMPGATAGPDAIDVEPIEEPSAEAVEPPPESRPESEGSAPAGPEPEPLTEPWRPPAEQPPAPAEPTDPPWEPDADR